MGKILIIDDSAVVREEVRATLASAGFEMLQAVDGVDGPAKLEEDPEISLVLCDINMPRMGGLNLLDEVVRPEQTLTAKIRREVFKGEMRKPLVAASEKDCLSAVAADRVPSASSARRAPAACPLR
jgi:CheY-like chemotaxis protein